MQSGNKLAQPREDTCAAHWGLAWLKPEPLTMAATTVQRRAGVQGHNYTPGYTSLANCLLEHAQVFELQ